MGGYRQTDMTKLVITLRNFSKEPKTLWIQKVLDYMCDQFQTVSPMTAYKILKNFKKLELWKQCLKPHLIGQARDSNRRNQTDFNKNAPYTAVSLKDTLVVQADSGRPVIMESRVQSVSSPCVIFGGRSDTKTEISHWFGSSTSTRLPFHQSPTLTFHFSVTKAI